MRKRGNRVRDYSRSFLLIWLQFRFYFYLSCTIKFSLKCWIQLFSFSKKYHHLTSFSGGIFFLLLFLLIFYFSLEKRCNLTVCKDALALYVLNTNLYKRHVVEHRNKYRLKFCVDIDVFLPSRNLEGGCRRSLMRTTYERLIIT